MQSTGLQKPFPVPGNAFNRSEVILPEIERDNQTGSRLNWNFEELVFVEGGEPENPEKNPRSRDKNQQQTQPTHGTGPESNPGHIGGRRALSPLRHPCCPISLLGVGGRGLSSQVVQREGLSENFSSAVAWWSDNTFCGFLLDIDWIEWSEIVLIEWRERRSHSKVSQSGTHTLLSMVKRGSSRSLGTEHPEISRMKVVSDKYAILALGRV
ncbi:hypothetical protein ACROYT_G012840 [Oculina patagonica]